MPFSCFAIEWQSTPYLSPTSIRIPSGRSIPERAARSGVPRMCSHAGEAASSLYAHQIKKHCLYDSCHDALICHTNDLASRDALKIEYWALRPAIVVEEGSRCRYGSG